MAEYTITRVSPRTLLPIPEGMAPTEIVSSILRGQGAGISSIFLRAATVDQIKAQMEQITTWMTLYDGNLKSAITFDKAGKLKDMAEGLGKLIDTETTRLLGYWIIGIGLDMGSAFQSIVETYTGFDQLLSMYQNWKVQIALGSRMRRYWNQVYTPMVPDASLAFTLYMRNKITWDQFKGYTSMQGWDETNTGLLFDSMVQMPPIRMAMELLYKNVITDDQFKTFAWAEGWTEEYHELLKDWMDRVPDNWTAFNMWARGLLKEDERNAVYKANLFPEEWHDKITESFMYVPGPYELMRMADFVEVDQIWALDMLKRRGIAEKDRAKFWDAIQIRPLREEVRALTTEWIWRYRYGRCTHDDLETALTELPIRTKERELDIQKAELQYQDELVDEWIAILQWRFRTAVITEDEFMQGLLDLEIVEEKANLIVELEKAKGYYGGYGY